MTSSVTCFKATAGAEADSAAGDIFDALGDTDIGNIDMEPLDTSDLVSEQADKILISVLQEDDASGCQMMTLNNNCELSSD